MVYTIGLFCCGDAPDADPYKGGAEYDLAWILSYRAGTETRPYKPSHPVSLPLLQVGATR